MTRVIKHEIKMEPEMYAVLSRMREAIINNGGYSLLVGGAVRDSLLGVNNPKDVDVETYHIQGNILQEILKEFGEVRLAGKYFGVFKVHVPHLSHPIDVSMARRENKIGKSHASFTVDTDISIVPEEAALRRDYTINTFAYDLNRKQVYDYFDALTDLQSNRLVAVSTAFDEDPLRVLRGMRFAAQFNFVIDFDTIGRCYGLKDEFKTISKERVWEEFKGMFVKGQCLSQGIKVLKYTGWIENFPEIAALVGIEQEPEYHPEGDVFTHTMLTMDEVPKIALRDGLREDERLVLGLAMLCHDMGKPVTTDLNEDGRIISHGHDKAGAPIAESFLDKIGAPDRVIHEVTNLVREHMVTVNGKLSPRAIFRLADRLSPSNITMLEHVVEADMSGRPPLEKGRPAFYLIEEAQKLACAMQPVMPFLRGQDLVDRGIPPGKIYGDILRDSMEQQVEGNIKNREEAVAWLEGVLAVGV